jgi:6-phosphogluconolactonase
MKEVMYKKETLRVSKDVEQLADDLAGHLIELSKETINQTGKFTIALSGGSTPKALFEALKKPEYSSKFPWDKTYFFWSDERCVPPYDHESNFAMAWTTLLSHVNIPHSNVLRFEGQEENPAKSASNYEATIKDFFGTEIPAFDLIMLGLGEDGHTASLFPGTKALNEEKKLVCQNWVEKLNCFRLTFSYPLINAAQSVYFMVAGASKQNILKSVLDDKYSSSDNGQRAVYPAGRVAPIDGELLWYTDEAAIAELSASCMDQIKSTIS